MTKLSDTFYLKRAGSYSDPLNSNDRLPVVYGDVSDGSAGNWTLPCLNATDWVYAYAGHEVLSAANGNSITIYEDDMELTGGGVDYSFNAANDYESHGVIATIDMVHPKDNAIITARGSGKPTTSGGATLMENIIDIVYDFLVVENDMPADIFESTSKAVSQSTFASQSYKAAGVIDSDSVIWDVVVRMMGSFLGSAYVNGNGLLVLDIDTNVVPLGVADIIGRGGAYLKEAVIKLENLINQCPCVYAYSYKNIEFKSSTDATAHADVASQGIFGVRKPTTPYNFYWCRDLTSVQTVQDIIVEKLKGPIYEINIIDATLKHIGVDIGDHIAYSADTLYDQSGVAMTNSIWKVVSVNPEYSKGRITFSALQTPYYLTLAYIADGSYTADGSIRAGGDRDTTIY